MVRNPKERDDEDLTELGAITEDSEDDNLKAKYDLKLKDSQKV